MVTDNCAELNVKYTVVSRDRGNADLLKQNLLGFKVTIRANTVIDHSGVAMFADRSLVARTNRQYWSTTPLGYDASSLFGTLSLNVRRPII